MPRPGVTSAVITELEASSNRPVYLFSGEFAYGWLYLTTCDHNLTWNTHTYLGNGVFRGFRGYKESLEGAAPGMELSFSGVTNEMLVTGLDSILQGTSGVVHMAFLDGPGGNIIADPIIIFDGVIDIATIVESQGSADMTITLESRRTLYDRPKGYRYSQESQNQLYPGLGDTGFRYALRLDRQKLNWGKKLEETGSQAPSRRRGHDDRRGQRRGGGQNVR